MKTFLRKITGITLSILSPGLIFAQTAPNLGTAAKKFVLFTSAGALTNTNTPVRSQITGDVGTNSAAAVTGFVNVNGVIRPIFPAPTDPVASQADIDLNSAITQINTAPSTGSPASPLGAPGPGQTLTAGVYDVSGLTTISDNLFLDGQNNPNAVFIFRISGQLVSTFGAKVRMINQAQACNVFWRVAGSINLASETFMSGNLITISGAIDLTVKDTLQGRAFAKTAGAITTNGVFAYIPTGCGEPLPAGPARPVVGATASCYAIFTSSGGVTNTGISEVTGDIGTNFGAVGGYDPPTMVNGTVHPAPDASTSACAADVTNLYNALAALTPDITLNTPSEFGFSLVLTPHTYLLASATSLTDSVTLNSQGLTDAVFVIQIDGAFTAAALSKVKLTNGTQSKNVFWVVKNNAASWGVDALFNGNLVCAGAITVATGDSINGKIFTTAGAITTNASKIISDVSACGVAVPVTWLYFRGTPVKNNVILEWATSNETNNKFFTLEKSRDGINFDNLINVDAYAGPGNADRNYSFTDKLPYTLGYYRISQTDLDGRRSFYRTVQVRTDLKDKTSVISYVQGNQIHVQTSGTVAGNGSLSLYSIEGRKILSQNIFLNKEGNTFKIQKPLQSGVYILSINSGSEQIHSGKVVIF